MRWLLLVLMVIVLGVSYAQDAPQPTLVSSTDDFTPEKLKEYLRLKQVKHPEIVYAQAIVETGEFTSRIWKDNKNLFGMKNVNTCNCKITKHGSRATTAVGTRYGHARYRHWKHSVDDYYLWQSMFKVTPIDTEKQYLSLLKKYYAEDPNYIKKLRYVITRNKTPDT